MSNLTKLSVLLLLLFTLSAILETNAQIHEIKKKSSSNKSKRTSSSSGSSKKKSSKTYSSSSRSSGSDVDASDIFGCIGSIFDAAGCLINAIEITEDISADFASKDNDSYDYDDYLPEEYYENKSKVEEPYKEPENLQEEVKIENPSINNENEIQAVKTKETKNTKIIEPYENKQINNNTVKEKGEVSLDIRAHFDLSLHKGIDKNYVHVDYLPGLRANFDIFLIDFRFNVLTEYTDDFPDSFKSWEFLALFNLTARQDYSIIIGTGLQREQFDEGISFHEWYLGTKIPLKNKKDYIDIDTRFSRDYKTDEFPFFEFGGRYNVRFLNEKNLSGYFTFGATYQNYYQSYDIWGIRGGVVLNIH